MKSLKSVNKLSVFLLTAVIASASISVLTFAWFTSGYLYYSQRGEEPVLEDFELNVSFRPKIEPITNNIIVLSDDTETACDVYMRFIFSNDPGNVQVEKNGETICLYKVIVDSDVFYVYPYALSSGDTLEIVSPYDSVCVETILAEDYILACAWRLSIINNEVYAAAPVHSTDLRVVDIDPLPGIANEENYEYTDSEIISDLEDDDEYDNSEVISDLEDNDEYDNSEVIGNSEDDNVEDEKDYNNETDEDDGVDSINNNELDDVVNP